MNSEIGFEDTKEPLLEIPGGSQKPPQDSKQILQTEDSYEATLKYPRDDEQ